MCWSPVASASIGSAGIVTSFLLWKRGESNFITIPLAYFSIMEFLQFASYFYIDSCSSPPNNILTFLSYIHISFQPIFFAMLFLYFHGAKVHKQMKWIAYAASGLATAVFLIKIIPFFPASLCTSGTLCGKNFCTVSGKWHLAWKIPWYNFPIPFDLAFYYAIPVFIVPLFYRAWSGVGFSLIFGPVLAYVLTPNPNEWPAIWCLFSVPLILYLCLRYYKQLRKFDTLVK